MAHLVVGAVAIVGFLITGLLMNAHEPPVMKMGWDQRLLFNSRHIYLMSAGLVEPRDGRPLPAADGARAACRRDSRLAAGARERRAAVFCILRRTNGGPLARQGTSGYGLFALFGGVLLYALASLVGRRAGP